MDFLTAQNPVTHLSGIQTATDYFNLRYKYLLVPVWINTFAYDGRNYIIVINGHPGKINGQWPKSFGTLMKKAVELFF